MSTEAFRVGVVLSPRGWSGRLHAFIADHVHDVDLFVVRDQRAALEASPHVLLIDDVTPWLNSKFAQEAERNDVLLIGVYDRLDGGVSRSRLAALGLTHLIEEAMPPEDVVFLLDRLRPTGSAEHGNSSLHGETSVEYEQGAVVAVGGASGSGAREIAVALASAFACRGRATLLVDLNETTPGIARRLGLGVYPHLLTAVERLRVNDGDCLEASLAEGTERLPFDVIVGMPSPRDWDRIVGNDVDDLLDRGRHRWERVVVTTSPLIEDLQRWGDRFGISRRAILKADVVVGCVEPTPRGVLRYLDWLADASVLGAVPVTVVNKTTKAKRTTSEVVRQLRDVAGPLVDDVAEVPADRLVTVAEWDGTLVKRGPFTKAMDSVSRHIDHRLSTASLQDAS